MILLLSYYIILYLTKFVTIKISRILLALFKWDNDKIKTVSSPWIWLEPLTALTHARNKWYRVTSESKTLGDIDSSWLSFITYIFGSLRLQRCFAILKPPYQRDHSERIQTEILNHHSSFWIFPMQALMWGITLQMSSGSTAMCRN